MTTYTLNNVIDDFHFTMLKIAAVYYYLAALPVHSTPKPNGWAKVSINLSLTLLNLQFPFLVPFHSSPIGTHGLLFAPITTAIPFKFQRAKQFIPQHPQRKQFFPHTLEENPSVKETVRTVPVFVHTRTHTYVRRQIHTRARASVTCEPITTHHWYHYRVSITSQS